MHLRKKSAGIVIVSLIFAATIEACIGYLLYGKWQELGDDFLMASDYTGIILVFGAALVLILELILVITTCFDREEINVLRMENADLNYEIRELRLYQKKKKSEAVQPLNAEKTADDRKASEPERKYEEASSRNKPETDPTRELCEETADEMETSSNMNSSSEHNLENMPEAADLTIGDRAESSGPDIAEESHIIKEIDSIKAKLEEIDQQKKYPTTILEIVLNDMTADEYYADMRNLFRRRAVWTATSDNRLLLLFINEKKQNIIHFIWDHIVYQKEVKSYNFYDVDEENLASGLELF